MTKISLSSYTIRVKDRQKGKYLSLDDLLSKGDFYSFVEEYFKVIETDLQRDEENKKLIRINNGNIRKIKRHIKGVLETGEYGFESDIIDSNTGKSRYKRKPNDAEMLPFYFLISLPKGKDKGIILLQRFGQFGVSKIIRDSMRQFLAKKDKNLTLEFFPLVPTNLVEEYLKKGNVTKMIFTRFDIPSDLADYFDNRNSKDVKGHVEFRVVAARNSKLPVTKSLNILRKQGKGANKLMEINKFDFNSVKVVVNHNNDRRTINLENFDRMRAYYDVTGEVKIGSNGHPTYESIDKSATNLLSELNELIYPNQDV